MRKRTNVLENVEDIQEIETITETTEVTEVTEDNTILTDIHNDLGLICCFLVFFTLVIILKYAYKFFNMVFKF